MKIKASDLMRVTSMTTRRQTELMADGYVIFGAYGPTLTEKGRRELDAALAHEVGLCM